MAIVGATIKGCVSFDKWMWMAVTLADCIDEGTEVNQHDPLALDGSYISTRMQHSIHYIGTLQRLSMKSEHYIWS